MTCGPRDWRRDGGRGGRAAGGDLGEVALGGVPAAVALPEAAVGGDDVVLGAAAVLVRREDAHAEAGPRVGAGKGLGLRVEALEEVVGVAHVLEGA